ncbi:hypothetical protein ncot_10615 [Nocardioides sp. JQ2195]|uniref:hypothetical protein n=1 Tax=Nocardioides sp. JQ2195 TaxID=2592334 RepID=UPI00143E8139|nr:hypothetical protein [Nocardioides sp. JQ2195]QIX26995.1 hypothetical protein ncot_10615 [Nocardioides sp. JQ2195]
MLIVGVVIYWAILEIGNDLSGANEEDTANGDGDPFAGFLFIFLPMCIAGFIYIPACIWALIQTGRRERRQQKTSAQRLVQ